MAMPIKRGPYGRKPLPVAAKAKKQTNFVKAWRLFRGLTLEELAGKADYTAGSLSAVERGEQGLSDESRERIAKALKITPGMLMEVDPAGDPELWTMIVAASPEEREQIAKVAKALVGRK